jgi:hypothetical protein
VVDGAFGTIRVVYVALNSVLGSLPSREQFHRASGVPEVSEHACAPHASVSDGDVLPLSGLRRGVARGQAA